MMCMQWKLSNTFRDTDCCVTCVNMHQCELSVTADFKKPVFLYRHIFPAKIDF